MFRIPKLKGRKEIKRLIIIALCTWIDPGWVVDAKYIRILLIVMKQKRR